MARRETLIVAHSEPATETSERKARAERKREFVSAARSSPAARELASEILADSAKMKALKAVRQKPDRMLRATITGGGFVELRFVGPSSGLVWTATIPPDDARELAAELLAAADAMDGKGKP